MKSCTVSQAFWTVIAPQISSCKKTKTALANTILPNYPIVGNATRSVHKAAAARRQQNLRQHAKARLHRVWQRGGRLCLCPTTMLLSQRERDDASCGTDQKPLLNGDFIIPKQVPKTTDGGPQRQTKINGVNGLSLTRGRRYSTSRRGQTETRRP